jgi:hypothetical protein
MDETRTTGRNDQQIISYLALRKLIGLAGIFLPILLPIGCFIHGSDSVLQDSISDYYYTQSRDVFVGILFVLGFFLLTYRGYESVDSTFANFGFVFAIDVALFPCRSCFTAVRVIHFTSAGLLFAVFIWFSLVLFTKSDKPVPTRRKKQRNTVYLICGWIMVACIVGIGLSFMVFTQTQRADYNIIFWLESVALWSFGYSWLTKGQFMLKD